MPNKINALSGAIQTLAVIASGVDIDDMPHRADVFRDEIGDCIVDTCCAFDTGSWETGVERNDDHFVIVEQYDDREAAESGHKAWVAKLTADPAMELSDVMVWDL